MKHLLNTLYILSEDIYVFLCRGIPCPDGSLRRASDRSGLLHAQREISGKGVRRKQRKCAASTDPVPCCG